MSEALACNREIASVFIRQILDRIGPQAGRVLLVGSDQIELLIALASCGFAEVTCRSAQAGPGIAERSADVVLAPTLYHQHEYAASLRRIERALRPGGMLIVGISSSPLKMRGRQIRKLLVQRGFAFVSADLEVGGLQMLCCRKVTPAMAAAA